MTIASNFPAIKPSLLLDFANTERLDPRITFTRTTTATYYDDKGILKTAAAGVARFDHNPTTGESLGLLVEEQRTNLLTYSDDFSNAAYTKVNTTITANSVVAPDGTLTGDTVVMDNVSNDDFYLYQVYSGWTSGVTYTRTWYVKSAGISWVQVTGSTGTAVTAFRNINITTGALGNGNYASGSVTATSVGNGWYRISVTETANSTSASGRFLLVLLTSDVAARLTNVNGDGYSGIYIWGAQFEAGAFPTSYIPTTAATVTRNADAASMTGTNFSSWFNNAEGTVYFESQTAQGTNSYPWSLFGSSTQNRIFASYGSNLKIDSGTRINGTFDALVSTPNSSAPLNTFGKGATAYKVNDFGFSWNGAATLTDTSTTLPIVQQFDIGNNGALSGNWINGTIKKIAYYPSRLTNAQLQALTS